MAYKKSKNINKDEHVIVMEEYLGRPLENDEVVHHLDENKQYNAIENLELCLRSTHSRYHQKKGDYFDVATWNKENAKGYKHGTYSCWRKTKCRCDACVQAQREYKRAYRQRTGKH